MVKLPYNFYLYTTIKQSLHYYHSLHLTERKTIPPSPPPPPRPKTAPTKAIPSTAVLYTCEQRRASLLSPGGTQQDKQSRRQGLHTPRGISPSSATLLFLWSDEMTGLVHTHTHMHTWISRSLEAINPPTKHDLAAACSSFAQLCVHVCVLLCFGCVVFSVVVGDCAEPVRWWFVRLFNVGGVEMLIVLICCDD